MRAALKTRVVLTFALVLTGQFAGVGRVTAADSPEASSTVTICAHNYARVDDKTMEKAEKVAAGIFRKVGVGIRWVDIDLTSEGKSERSLGKEVFALCRIHLNIFPHKMAERLDVPGNAMGLAPGSETDRQVVYIFYDRVEAISQTQLEAQIERRIDRFASKSQILGHVIAHEIGHLLLNIESHSKTGIMRGVWDPNDLRDAAFGYLVFTPQQAEGILTEVVRRASRQELLVGVGLESSAETMPVITTSK